MPATSPLYRLATSVARGAIGLAASSDSKLGRGHAGRLHAVEGFATWARDHRDTTRPLLWCHAPSVGEGLQAEAVLRRIRRHHPDWQLAYTWFSPSAEAFARRLDVDVRGYLPYDLPAESAAMLDALQPSALVFSKLDLWPELAVQAASRGVPVALIAATVRPGSGRLRWPVRSLLEPGYRCVTAAAAIAEADAERLAQLGVIRERIQVTGDPRFDSALERVQAVAADDPLLKWSEGFPALVAGSTWPGDEAVILGAYARVRQRYPEARLILAPHEPTPDHLHQVEERARTAGCPAPARLTDAPASAPIVLVDRVGVLATLYGAGTMSYVGGGFHAAGLHSVLEPAAWGKPVTFGPRWRESYDAVLLVMAAGATPLAAEATGAAIEELSQLWIGWLDHASVREAQGQRALNLVRSGLGAADRSVHMVEGLIRQT
jgi:3-deoxy-D-manno-octulosonic-acid transferase